MQGALMFVLSLWSFLLSFSPIFCLSSLFFSLFLPPFLPGQSCLIYSSVMHEGKERKFIFLSVSWLKHQKLSPTFLFVKIIKKIVQFTFI